MKEITLTNLDDYSVNIPIDQISFVGPAVPGKTCLWINGLKVFVKEDIETVTNALLEARNVQKEDLQ